MLALFKFFTTTFVVSGFVLLRFGLGRHAVLLEDPVTFAKVLQPRNPIRCPRLSDSVGYTGYGTAV